MVNNLFVHNLNDEFMKNITNKPFIFEEYRKYVADINGTAILPLMLSISNEIYTLYTYTGNYLLNKEILIFNINKEINYYTKYMYIKKDQEKKYIIYTEDVYLSILNHINISHHINKQHKQKLTYFDTNSNYYVTILNKYFGKKNSLIVNFINDIANDYSKIFNYDIELFDVNQEVISSLTEINGLPNVKYFSIDCFTDKLVSENTLNYETIKRHFVLCHEAKLNVVGHIVHKYYKVYYKEIYENDVKNGYEIIKNGITIQFSIQSYYFLLNRYGWNLVELISLTDLFIHDHRKHIIVLLYQTYNHIKLAEYIYVGDNTISFIMKRKVNSVVMFYDIVNDVDELVNLVNDSNVLLSYKKIVLSVINRHPLVKKIQLNNYNTCIRELYYINGTNYILLNNIQQNADDPNMIEEGLELRRVNFNIYN